MKSAEVLGLESPALGRGGLGGQAKEAVVLAVLRSRCIDPLSDLSAPGGE